jgi:hypothetical protein
VYSVCGSPDLCHGATSDTDPITPGRSLSEEDPTMAKALLGHVAAVDHRMVAEMRRLKQRVDDLEAYVSRLEDENATLAAHSRSLDSELRDELDLARREPALT